MPFLKTGWCEEVFKKGVLEQTTRALAGADILHNVIIVHTDCSIGVDFLFMHYNATLCKIAWGKKLLA